MTSAEQDAADLAVIEAHGLTVDEPDPSPLAAFLAEATDEQFVALLAHWGEWNRENPELAERTRRETEFHARAQGIGYIRATEEAAVWRESIQRARVFGRLPSRRLAIHWRLVIPGRRISCARPALRQRRRRRPSATRAGPGGDDPGGAPPHVKRFARREGLAIEQLRWCWRCGAVAYAIDDHQRAQLDAAGFVDGQCPQCRMSGAR